MDRDGDFFLLSLISLCHPILRCCSGLCAPIRSRRDEVEHIIIGSARDMKTRKFALLGLIFPFWLISISSPVHAVEVFMHGWQFNTNLYSVDTDTGIETLIGNSGRNNVGGLSFSGANVLYGLTVTGFLYTFNVTTAAPTLIGSTGLSLEGLSFASNGTTLYASGGSSLHTIDLNTGMSSLVGSIALSEVDGLTVAPISVNTIAGTFPAGTLFSTDTNTISAIDPNSLAVTTLGSAEADEALAFAPDGTLYGHNFGDSLYEIDLLTLNSTLVANTSGPIAGLAVLVPEPSTVILAPSGLLPWLPSAACAASADPLLLAVTS